MPKTKRTYKPNKRKTKKRHGFMIRMKKKKNVLKRRILKGRTKISS